MGQAEVVHPAFGTAADVTLRIVEQFEHQPVAHQVGRVQADRLLELQQLIGALVGWFEFPPELEAEQALIEAPRPLAIRDTQSDVVENRSMACHYSLP